MKGLKAENAILSKWVDKHLLAEIKHGELYGRGGPLSHKHEALAHARAAVALQEEVAREAASGGKRSVTWDEK